MFKKRSRVSNPLKSEVVQYDEGHQSGAEEETVVDSRGLNSLKEVKESQSLRLKSRGLKVDSLELGDQESSKKTSSVSGVKRSIESVMDSQFAVQKENGLGGAMSHEQLMEKYVQEKLGLAQDNGLEKDAVAGRSGFLCVCFLLS